MISLRTVSHQAGEAVYLETTDWVQIPVLEPLDIGWLEYGGDLSLTLFLGLVGKLGGISAFSVEARIVDAKEDNLEIARVLVSENVWTVVTLPCTYSVGGRARPQLVAQWRCFGRTVPPDTLFFQGATMSLTALVIPFQASET